MLLYLASLQLPCDYVYTEPAGFFNGTSNATAGPASVSIATWKWDASTECAYKYSAISASTTTAAPWLSASLIHVSPPPAFQPATYVSAVPVPVSTINK